MKKVLFVSHTLDFSAGGAERVLLAILERLDREQFTDSLAMSRDRAGVPASFQQLGFSIHLFAGLPMLSSRNLWSVLKVGFALLSSASSLWFHLRRDRYDLVHINSVFALHFALLPCLLTGTPAIYHEHGLPKSRETSLWSIAYGWLIRRVQHTIAITAAVKQEITRYDVNHDHITTMHNAIVKASAAASSDTRPTDRAAMRAVDGGG